MFIFYFWIFILGVVIGSFLNVVILRTYYGDSFLRTRSFCPSCRKKIVWYDNIPLWSFFMLKGRCRNCNRKISFQYPVVELVSGILFLAVFYIDFNFLNLKSLFVLLRDWLIVSILIVIFVQDLKWYVILDKIILPATGIVFGLNLFLREDFWNLSLAAFIGAGFFLWQFLISRGRWVGEGDIRLGAFMGVVLGFPKILIALFLAYILGSLIGIFLVLINKKKMSSKMPLAVFLVPATFAVLFGGDKILNWYFKNF